MPKRRQRDCTQLAIWDNPDAEHEKRTCPVCSQPKPLTSQHYYQHKGYRQGFDNICRDCRNEYKRTWNKAHGQAVREKTLAALGLSGLPRYKHLKPRRAPSDAEYSATTLVAGIRGRIKKYGRTAAPEMLDRKFVTDWLLRQPDCECCGTKLLLGPKGKLTGASPSFDRFNSSEGYTISNTALVCWSCNRIKSNHNAPALRMVAEWIERRQTQS